MLGVSYVLLLLTGDQERAAGDPHRLPRMILGVDGEHTAGADHHMIDVRLAGTDGHRMQNEPASAQTCQSATHRDFT
jgi:hypothetical protein